MGVHLPTSHLNHVQLNGMHKETLKDLTINNCNGGPGALLAPSLDAFHHTQPECKGWGWQSLSLLAAAAALGLVTNPRYRG